MRPRQVEEICAKAKLDVAYHATLVQLITRIEAGGCDVMTREDGIPSSYDPCTEPPLIRVNVKNVETSLKIFWDLLHEYGHHLSGKRLAEDNDLDREELAWEMADAHIGQYPDLLLRRDDYERCKEHDINTYRAYYAKKNR